jgi:hypothetical protein
MFNVTIQIKIASFLLQLIASYFRYILEQILNTDDLMRG